MGWVSSWKWPWGGSSSCLCAFVCVCVCVCVLVAQWCLTLCDPMNCSRPGSSVHGILPAKRDGLPFPSPGDLSHPGIKPGSPRLQTDASPSEPLGHSCLWEANSCAGGYRLDSWVVVLAFPSHCISVRLDFSAPSTVEPDSHRSSLLIPEVVSSGSSPW